MNINEENQVKIAQLKELKGLPIFKTIIDELDKIIADAEKVVFAVGADHKIEFTARDIALVKRDNAMQIKELPDMLIKLLAGTGTEKIPNPDAFSGEGEIENNGEIDKIFQDDYNNN